MFSSSSSSSSFVKRATSSVASSSLKAFNFFISSPISKQDLKVGDHIYAWRVAYSYAHHGNQSQRGERDTYLNLGITKKEVHEYA